MQTYLSAANVERLLNDNNDPTGIAAQVFNNKDFGYYKVNIERPDRRCAQFKPELIAPLRFDKQLREPMEHIYSVHGDSVYDAGYLKANDVAIYSWCEDNDINLNAKAKTKLLDTKMWLKLRNVCQMAEELLEAFGK